MKKIATGLALSALVLTAVPAWALQATLNWSDDGQNPTRVERRDGVDANPWVAQGASVPAGTTTFNQTGLVLGTRYCYRVIKTNAFGESAPTGPACGTPDVPLPASGLTVIFAP